MSDLISILIPTYNRAALIVETLDSIKSQTYNNWECVIVDDGSTDNSREIIDGYCKEDSRFRYYDRPENHIKGANGCRNYAFKMSQGKWIKWLDSDDLLHENTLAKNVVTLNENMDVIVSKLQFVDANLNFIKENNILTNNVITDYFSGGISFYVSGPLWNRNFLINQPSLFDENIRNLDDWDFNLRMLYKNPRIHYIDEPLVKYRVHENSLSHEVNKFNLKEIDSEILARKKHLNLLKQNNFIDLRKPQTYLKDRYKYFLREALVRKHKKSSYFLKKTLSSQFKLLNFIEMIKTLFWFIFVLTFKKGYKYLK